MGLIMLTEKTGYFEGPVTVGVHYAEKNRVILFDSGSDDSAARKMAGHFEKEGTVITAIINTHSHADHCGGNAHLQKRTGCRVYACGIEASLVRDPILEPMYLYGGGPLEALQNKFLQAAPTESVIRVSTGEQEIEGVTLELIDLSGHSPAMAGIRTPDDVLFLGDGLIGIETAARHKILYHFNLGGMLASLDAIETLAAGAVVLSHGGLCSDVAAVAADNRGRLLAVNDRILGHVQEPIGREDLLEKLLADFGLTPALPLYYLNLGIVSSHLAWLCREKQVEAVMVGNGVRYTAMNAVAE